MNGTTSSEAVRLMPVTTPLCFAAESTALYAFGWWLKLPNDDTKSLWLWASRMMPRAMNASSWMTTRPRMTWATRRSGRSESRPTITSRPTQMSAIAPLLVTWFAPAAIIELENASPRPVRANGMNAAVNWAFAARM